MLKALKGFGIYYLLIAVGFLALQFFHGLFDGLRLG